MENYVIKASGTMDEVLTALKTMQAVFGTNAKVSDIAKMSRLAQIKNAVNNQFEKGERE